MRSSDRKVPARASIDCVIDAIGAVRSLKLEMVIHAELPLMSTPAVPDIWSRFAVALEITPGASAMVATVRWPSAKTSV